MIDRSKPMTALFAIAAMMAGVPLSAQPGTAAGIAGFQAFLFNSGKGTFSPDIIKNRVALGNVVASEYDSVSTFIVVAVSSGSAPLPETARLTLTATAAGRKGARVLIDSSQRPKPSGNPGVTHVGFWLPDTGCDPVTLRATLTVGGRAASQTTKLDFHCSE